MDIRRFLTRLLVFSIPLLALLPAIEIQIYMTGETWTGAHAARRQFEQPESLYGRAVLSQDFYAYKSSFIALKKPKILAVGNSRANQFRDFMFEPFSAEFYNGNLMIRKMADLSGLAMQLEEGKLPRPDMLIVVIDEKWLNFGAPESPSWFEQDRPRDDALIFSAHVEAWRAAKRAGLLSWKTLQYRAGDLSPYFGYPAFGLSPLRFGDGFRGDGSYLYAEKIIAAAKSVVYKDSSDLLALIRHNQYPAPDEKALNPRLVAQLFDSLTQLSRMGIEVYAVLAPFSNEAYAELQNAPAYQRWWREYMVELPQELKKRGWGGLPSRTPRDYGLTDRVMIDGQHAGEVLTAHLLLELVQSAPKERRLAKVDRENLRSLLAVPAGPLLLREVPLP